MFLIVPKHFFCSKIMHKDQSIFLVILRKSEASLAQTLTVKWSVTPPPNPGIGHYIANKSKSKIIHKVQEREREKACLIYAPKFYSTIVTSTGQFCRMNLWKVNGPRPLLVFFELRNLLTYSCIPQLEIHSRKRNSEWYFKQNNNNQINLQVESLNSVFVCLVPQLEKTCLNRLKVYVYLVPRH